MQPLIGMRIRMSSAFDQREPQDIVFNIITVFGVVQQADTITLVGQICPLMPDRLEARPIPARIPMCRPFHVAELNVIGCLSRADADGESHLQQLLLLVPIYFGHIVDAAGSRHRQSGSA